jgi:hypothetical protein
MDMEIEIYSNAYFTNPDATIDMVLKAYEFRREGCNIINGRREMVGQILESVISGTEGDWIYTFKVVKSQTKEEIKKLLNAFREIRLNIRRLNKVVMEDLWEYGELLAASYG